MLRKADKERFLQLLRNGTPMTFACRAIRMTPQTMANYKARAAQEEQPYAAFLLDVEQAQAEYVIGRLRVLDADAIGAPTGDKRERGDGRSLTWLLERLHPKEFSPTTKAEVTGKDGAPLVVGGATPETAAQLLRVAFGDHARRALEQDEAEGNEDV